MSWYHLSEVARHPLPKGNKHVGKEQVIRVLLYYAELADEDGQAYPSQGAVAEELNLGHREVQHSQTCLKEQGYLSETRAHVKGHRGTTYQIFMPPQATLEQIAEEPSLQAPHQEPEDVGANRGVNDGANDGANDGHVPCTTEEQNYRATEVILAHSENLENALDPPVLARAINTALKKYKFLCGNHQVLGRSALYDIAESELLEKAQKGTTETELESIALHALLALPQTG